MPTCFSLILSVYICVCVCVRARACSWAAGRTKTWIIRWNSGGRGTLMQDHSYSKRSTLLLKGNRGRDASWPDNLGKCANIPSCMSCLVVLCSCRRSALLGNIQRGGRIFQGHFQCHFGSQIFNQTASYLMNEAKICNKSEFDYGL